MADLGSTLDIRSYLATGTDGYFDGYSGLHLNTANTVVFMGYQTDNTSDYGNTILFPASAYEALVEPSIRFYKLRGYYVTGAIFETWVSRSPESSPPSGHTLTDITVVDTWIV